MNDHDQFQNEVKEAQDNLNECRRIINSVNANQRIWWEALAGNHLSSMLHSRSAAELFLSNEDARLRLVALSVLSIHWLLSASDPLSPMVEMLALHDADLQVRAMAITCLATYAQCSNDRKVARALAMLVSNEQERTEIRSSAYHALFLLRGELFDRAALNHERQNSFSFPEDVDWTFVNSFL